MKDQGHFTLPKDWPRFFRTDHQTTLELWNTADNVVIFRVSVSLCHEITLIEGPPAWPEGSQGGFETQICPYFLLSARISHTGMQLFPWSSVPLEGRDWFLFAFQLQHHQCLFECLTKRKCVESMCWANEWIWKPGTGCRESLRVYNWMSLR